MTSTSIKSFQHSIQDATDLLDHFDALNTKPPPPQIEVLKRASLIMVISALETYFEDRLVEAADQISGGSCADQHLTIFFEESLQNELKFFHSPSTKRVRPIFEKYLGFDITEGWSWNNFDPAKARRQLDNLVKKRGEIAHRSKRPVEGETQASPHAVTRNDLRKYIHFANEIVKATDAYIDKNLHGASVF